MVALGNIFILSLVALENWLPDYPPEKSIPVSRHTHRLPWENQRSFLSWRMAVLPPNKYSRSSSLNKTRPNLFYVINVNGYPWPFRYLNLLKRFVVVHPQIIESGFSIDTPIDPHFILENCTSMEGSWFNITGVFDLKVSCRRIEFLEIINRSTEWSGWKSTKWYKLSPRIFHQCVAINPYRSITVELRLCPWHRIEV